MKQPSITRFKPRLCTALALSFLLALTPPIVAADNAPPLMLANSYHPGIPLTEYWVSEKYDGVRGYWDGKRLLTRGGQPVIAPPWFTAGWPAIAMDGELWAGRGRFNHAVSTVRRETADDSAWRSMRFMVFDLPAHGGNFNQRLQALKTLIPSLKTPWVQAVEQIKISDHATLQRMLDRIVRQGGEGLMLHRGASLYQALRNDDLLKLKTHEDAEARVIAHLPGKGKYQGMMGALLVETPDGLRFKLGTGFSDDQRRHPPALGSLVTYRFRGLNPGGIPRFASFMREYQQ
ncbi:ATP dependent DNA ligase domain protein [Collimonas arenae]|uniref:ATP dependent DNA ligase domain protein n=1 Tax=Collimonas arenae TaxID=279058 RepID=A0A127PMQ1_9BURK|nr:DNA ligase [Collimonas arenae]AMO99076.1 ATP dependent DNA ligase domain protein [Collimonas arenae]AMP08976.1 ATP dependent DNA ligase domain protein [Collimonas arenae]